jgi:hypothetical protein
LINKYLSNPEICFIKGWPEFNDHTVEEVVVAVTENKRSYDKIFGDMIELCLLDHKKCMKYTNIRSFDNNNILHNGNGKALDTMVKAAVTNNIAYQQQVIQRQKNHFILPSTCPPVRRIL